MVRLKQLKEMLKDIDSTKIFFTDLNGRNRSLPINAENLEAIIKKGIGFDGSSIAGIFIRIFNDTAILKFAVLGFFLGSAALLEFSLQGFKLSG